MRTLGDFKMERPGQVEVGQEVELREGALPNSVFYYVVEPAVAMSANISLGDRLVDKDGKVITKAVIKAIEEKSTGFYITIECED